MYSYNSSSATKSPYNTTNKLANSRFLRPHRATATRAYKRPHCQWSRWSTIDNDGRGRSDPPVRSDAAADRVRVSPRAPCTRIQAYSVAVYSQFARQSSPLGLVSPQDRLQGTRVYHHHHVLVLPLSPLLRWSGARSSSTTCSKSSGSGSYIVCRPTSSSASPFART